VTLERVHTHIGSGSDPAVWSRVVELSLNIARALPDATVVNLGGGYKVRRTDPEVTTDLQTIGMPVMSAFTAFASETGRELKLEIEPGTYLVARAGALVTTVRDVVTTGESGYKFAKIDAGMNDIMRPALYGSQHPIIVYQQQPTPNEADIVVVGHCCESGDLLTPARDEPDTLAPRRLAMPTVGDVLVVGGAGAYCSHMGALNYNSFPIAPEVLVEGDDLRHMRHRQQAAQLLENESPSLPFHKYHGTENDFVVVDERPSTEMTVTPERAAQICDRHCGVGADGLIFALRPTDDSDVQMRLFNSDGSEPEMCGNGVRCFAHFLANNDASCGRTEGLTRHIRVQTLAGTIKCAVNGAKVEVAMGPARLQPADIPTTAEVADTLEACATLQIDSGKGLVPIKVVPVGMGNPHCIVFCTAEEQAAYRKNDTLARNLEISNAFPAKTNVEFVHVETRSSVSVVVWERGAGWTRACGTGACATVVASSRLGLTDRKCTVKLPGGELDIDWRDDEVYMTGPAELAFIGSVKRRTV